VIDWIIISHANHVNGKEQRMNGVNVSMLTGPCQCWPFYNSSVSQAHVNTGHFIVCMFYKHMPILAILSVVFYRPMSMLAIL